FLVQTHMFFNDLSDEVSYCDGVFCGCGHLNKYSANSRSSDNYMVKILEVRIWRFQRLTCSIVSLYPLGLF
ncbi:hypothetical protein H5410_021361, partial [Solanum commersonii]